MKKTILLLTGCINPNGMTQTKLTNVAIRKTQYVEAIKWYLIHTKFPIVFVENSNTPLTEFKNSNRLELLSYNGNQDKTKGKGYGEMQSIEYALHHSKFLNNNSVITKITGRLIVTNINSLIRLNYWFAKKHHVQCQIHSDLSFADSRIFTASKTFFDKIASQKEELNDKEGYFFEHLLAANLKDRYLPYFVQPAITGMSGTTGETYMEGYQSLKDRISYLRYQLYLFRKMKHK